MPPEDSRWKALRQRPGAIILILLTLLVLCAVFGSWSTGQDLMEVDLLDLLLIGVPILY